MLLKWKERNPGGPTQPCEHWEGAGETTTLDT